MTPSAFATLHAAPSSGANEQGKEAPADATPFWALKTSICDTARPRGQAQSPPSSPRHSPIAPAGAARGSPGVPAASSRACGRRHIAYGARAGRGIRRAFARARARPLRARGVRAGRARSVALARRAARPSRACRCPRRGGTAPAQRAAAWTGGTHQQASCSRVSSHCQRACRHVVLGDVDVRRARRHGARCATRGGPKRKLLAVYYSSKPER